MIGPEYDDDEDDLGYDAYIDSLDYYGDDDDGY